MKTILQLLGTFRYRDLKLSDPDNFKEIQQVPREYNAESKQFDAGARRTKWKKTKENTTSVVNH